MTRTEARLHRWVVADAHASAHDVAPSDHRATETEDHVAHALRATLVAVLRIHERDPEAILLEADLAHLVERAVEAELDTREVRHTLKRSGDESEALCGTGPQADPVTHGDTDRIPTGLPIDHEDVPERSAGGRPLGHPHG